MPEQYGKHTNRNFINNIIEGALWVAGAALVSPLTVLPALITRLGGGNLDIGAIGVIVYSGLFLPQIFAARYAQTIQWKKPYVLGFGMAQRLTILLSGIVIFAFGETHPILTLWLFLLLFTLNQTILGIVTPIWFDFVIKLTPLKRRGKLAGIRNSLAGGLSLLGTILLTWLLSAFPYPLNYSLVFFCTFLLQAIAIIFQARLIEEKPSEVHNLHPLKEYFGHLREIIKTNKSFKNFLLTSVFLILASMPLAFYTVYAMKHFGADEGMIGRFTLITVVGQIIGALVNGFIADRYGNKIALLSASLSILGAGIIALFSPSIEIYSTVFFCVGIFLGSELMTRYNFAVEFAPENQRAIYIGMMNTLLSPVYLSALVGGVISDSFGYPTLFLAGVVFSVIGIGLLIFTVEEPRK